jgi:hypothetical protein
VLRSGGPNHSKFSCVHVLDVRLAGQAKRLSPFLILGFRAGALRHPNSLSDNDIVLTTSTADLLQRTIGALQREFAMKDLGASSPLPRHHRRASASGSLPPPVPIRHRHLETSWHVRLQTLLHVCRHSGEAL